MLIETLMLAGEQTRGVVHAEAATRAIEVKWSLVGNLDKI